MARIIQRVVYNHVGIYVTVGIGESVTGKLALDNGAKHSPDFIAEWRYDRVPDTRLAVAFFDRFCGIGRRMAKRLNRLELIHMS